MEQLIEQYVDFTQRSEVLKQYYTKLFTDGVLLDLLIRKWGMSATLDEEDLDIKKVPDIFRLGKKLLIKPAIFNQFSQIEQRARTYLKKCSRPFPISQNYFVPLESLPEVEIKLNSFKEEYEELTTNFLENYEFYKEEVLTDFSDYRDILKPCYPALAEIRNKFEFSYTQFRIDMPTAFEKVDIHVKLAEEKQVQDLMVQHQIKFQEQVEKQINLIINFAESSVLDLRKGINRACALIVTKIKNGDIVSSTNKKTLLNEIYNFKKLNVFEDKMMENQLDKLESLLLEDRNFKDDTDSRKILNDYLNDVMDIAINTSDVSSITGEYLRSIEI
jgi:Protein of unknown function (DUF3150)